MKFDNRSQAANWFDRVFTRAARIVEGDTWYKANNEWHQRCPGREWFARERRAHNLHGAIHDMILDHLYRPHDWHQLLLEWPHKSQTDPNRLAYTRDERSGEADRQVVTTIGKYLARHFPDAPDHLIRDIVAQHTYGGEIKLTKDLSQMIHAVIHGPASCMTKEFNIRCDDGVRRHPYAVYDPSLGWGMAVRSDGESIMGRCLVWVDPDDDTQKVFVRSYKRERGEVSHSGTDEAIEAWLKTQGYQRHSEWPEDTPLMEHKAGGGWLMPYIDGGTQRVEISKRGMYITENGDIEADNTGGTADSGTDICSHCGARYNSEDEGIWVGVYEDEHVCGNCEDEYTYVTGRRGNQYYIPNADAIEVDGEYYHDEYLSDNSIVQLANGEYTHIDNAVWIESRGEYYDCDDDDICYAEDTSQYELKHDCWQCTESGNWYTEDEESVEIDGDLYHPDNAPEQETEEGEQA